MFTQGGHLINPIPTHILCKNFRIKFLHIRRNKFGHITYVRLRSISYILTYYNLKLLIYPIKKSKIVYNELRGSAGKRLGGFK